MSPARLGLAAALLLPALLAARSVTVSVDPGSGRRPLSPLSFGSNNNFLTFAPLRRLGGNRMTGYNWENNASSAGADWKQSNDFWMLSQVEQPLPTDASQAPGAVLTAQARAIRSHGAEPILTLQMAGFVAADGDGPVSRAQSAPSKRWKPVLFNKPGAPASFRYPPDKSDDAVYMDELMAHLVATFKDSPGGKIKYYCLDNEPDIWSDGKGGHTHGQLHKAQASYAEVVERSVALAKAALSVDPDAQFFAPVNYGWNGFKKLQDAPDHAVHNAKYGWFVAYYLDQMQKASAAAGKRLLHYYDLHYYSEAQGPSGRVNNTPSRVSRADCEARMQAPRSLWDPSYVEDSWITKHSLTEGDKAIRLIPRLKADIEKYYPGTQLAFTEWQFGAEDHISGGLAACDALGIFSSEGVAACAWPQEKHEYLEAAFRLYLGEGGAIQRRKGIGDTSVAAQSSDVAAAPAYAGVYAKDPTMLMVMVLNRTWDETLTVDIKLALPEGARLSPLNTWRLGEGSPEIKGVSNPKVTSAGIQATLPKLSATLFSLKMQAGKGRKQP